jgi:hypothetical protein
MSHSHETSWEPRTAIREEIWTWMLGQFPSSPDIETRYRDYDNGLMVYAWRAQVGDISYTLRATRQLLDRMNMTPERLLQFLEEKKVANRLKNDPHEWVCVGEDRRGNLALVPDTRPPGKP